ncbi:MAG: sigma-70 family RNA polymerase sigma factor [Clostridia bacterium]|nr:sigma-70 family RNA polymerase sigma factor [Clostridia bacterium]
MDKQEFTRRVLAVEGRLYRIGCGMLREPQDRLDAVQEAVLKAWQNRNRLRREEFFETWLTRILINECHNIQNARRRSAPMDELPEPAAPPEDGSWALRDALMALDEALRLPLLLSYMEGYRVREIAKILRIPEGTVKSRIARAKRKLRALLEEEGK